jgi:hypothetical protein
MMFRSAVLNLPVIVTAQGFGRMTLDELQLRLAEGPSYWATTGASVLVA